MTGEDKFIALIKEYDKQMKLLTKLGKYDITKLGIEEIQLLVQADQQRRTVERKAAQVKHGGGKGKKQKAKVSKVQG